MDFSKLKAEFDRWINEKGVPGAQIIVRKGYDEVFRHCAGYSDLEKSKPMTYDNVFWLYSMTKVFTATCIMRAKEQGLLQLDDPVEKYIPEFKNLKVKTENGIKPCETALTIRHLMTMTGGFGYDINGLPEANIVRKDPNATTLDVVKGMGYGPLLFEPGTDFQYSFCHDVAAAVLEVATGMTFGEYLKKEIFLPLGITDMGFHPTESQKERFAQKWRYTKQDDKLVIIPAEEYNGYALSAKYESGGAGLFGNAEQYMKFAHVLSNGGVTKDGYRLLTRESIDEMRTPEVHGYNLWQFIRKCNNLVGYGYGLGVRTLIEKCVSKGPLGEFGWDGAAGSYVLMDVENNITIVYTQYVMGHTPIYREAHPNFRDAVYEALGLAK